MAGVIRWPTRVDFPAKETMPEHQVHRIVDAGVRNFFLSFHN